METLLSYGMQSYLYGSTARGDVNEGSDIDIVTFVPNFYGLDEIPSSHRYIIMATPLSTPKLYISLDPEETKVISAPLGKLTESEEGFFKFGGIIGLKEVIEGKRVPGVNKRLKFIQPTERGHKEEDVISMEDYAAKVLGIPNYVVKERVKLLMKRRTERRSGVFLRYELRSDESITEAVGSFRQKARARV